MADSSPSRPRTPGLVNTAVVGVVVALVATVALTARQQPPPTIAEFAPQAVEQIEESLPEQAQAPGSASGGGGSQPAETATEEPTGAATEPDREREEEPTEDPSDEPEPDPSPPDEPRVRRCVGDPPRQTEDPQSPPCVPYFDGDNGGKTHQGVTGDEIRVAIPLVAFGGVPAADMELLIGHFNRRYEFYGRKIVPEFYSSEGGDFAQPKPARMLADAVRVDEEFQAFASLGYPDRKGSAHHYYDELARRGVLSSNYRAQSIVDEAHYQQFAPHQFNVVPSIENLLGGFGDMICRTLAGMPPQGGGGPGGDVTDPLGGDDEPGDRVFGLIFHRTPDGVIPPVDLLEGALDGCGVELAETVEDEADAPNSNAVLQMQEAEVTSVIYLGDPGPLRANYMPAATNQRYFPEWVVTSYLDNDLDNVFQPGTAPPEQTENLLGVSYKDKLLPRQNMPWYWAIRESDSERDPTGGNYYPFMSRYHQLLQLASGIQLAGPELTPETFERGLQAATFPNPGAGGAPYYQAAFDYAGRHTAFDSGALFYYDPQAGGTVDPGVPGAVCYVNDGTRYRVGQFPAGPQPFFDDPCH